MNGAGTQIYTSPQGCRPEGGAEPPQLQSYDAVLIATDNQLRLRFHRPHASLLVDTRNATYALREGREKIVRC